jgi:hypothetical protein
VPGNRLIALLAAAFIASAIAATAEPDAIKAALDRGDFAEAMRLARPSKARLNTSSTSR